MITNYTLNGILKELAGIAQFSNNNTYLALSSTEPNLDGGNVTEPSADLGYERRLFGYSANFLNGETPKAEMVDGVVRNKEIIYFGEATGNWGTLTHYCLFNAKTGGQLIAYGPLVEPITPTAETVPLIRAHQVQITMTNGD